MSLTDFVLNNNTWFEADCFDITLPNGSLLRATSHQNDLVVAGTTYYATKNGKWERGSTTQERNAVNEMELMLQCDESILFPNSVSTTMFQRAKLFARSQVKVTVAYMDLSEVIQGTQVVFNGVITIPSQESARVTFQCSDYGYLLQAAWPRRVICAGCPFTVFSSGEAQGWSIGIVQQLDATHLQLAPFDLPIKVGDTIDMYPGCTGTTDACQNKFSNLSKFGGFPYVPKTEGALTGG